MSDRPIIFSGAMVRALLTGRKTQTRRLAWRVRGIVHSPASWQYVAPRSRLYVREAWALGPEWDSTKPADVPRDSGAVVGYLADNDAIMHNGRARAAMHMPRWASRITLTLAKVRLQQLHDISEEDAQAEGIIPHPGGGWWCPGVEHPNHDFPYLARPTAREMFAALWDHVHGSGAWLRNPAVVAMTFAVEQRNIDAAS